MAAETQHTAAAIPLYSTCSREAISPHFLKGQRLLSVPGPVTHTHTRDVGGQTAEQEVQCNQRGGIWDELWDERGQ